MQILLGKYSMAQWSLNFCRTLHRKKPPNSQIYIYVIPSPLVSHSVLSCFHLLCLKSQRICHVKLQRIIKSVSSEEYKVLALFSLCQSILLFHSSREVTNSFIKRNRNVMTCSENLEIYCLRLCLMPRSQKLKN